MGKYWLSRKIGLLITSAVPASWDVAMESWWIHSQEYKMD
jgi:hypothetical protein